MHFVQNVEVNWELTHFDGMFAVLEGHIFPNCHILNRFYLARLTFSLSLQRGKIHYLCFEQISAPKTPNNEISCIYMQRKKE